MKNNESKFVEINEPSEEVIEEFHKQLAKGLINKYGKELIEKALKEINR